MVYRDGNAMAQIKPAGTQYVPVSARVKVKVKRLSHPLGLNLLPGFKALSLRPLTLEKQDLIGCPGRGLLNFKFV